MFPGHLCLPERAIFPPPDVQGRHSKKEQSVPPHPSPPPCQQAQLGSAHRRPETTNELCNVLGGRETGYPSAFQGLETLGDALCGLSHLPFVPKTNWTDQ